jgi:uncharacterized protein (TIRG00374 family)
MTARKLLRLGLGVLMAALFAWLTVRHLDLQRIGTALREAQPAGWLAAVALLCLGYLFRILRWHTMLRRENPGLRWHDCAGPLLAGFAANNVLPFRAGDLLRGLAFNARLGTSAGGALATLFVERLLDLSMMLVLLGAALWVFGFDAARVLGVGGPLLLLLATAVLAVLLFPCLLQPLAALLGRLAVRLPAAARVQAGLGQAMGTLTQLSGGSTMLRLLGWSALAWLAEGGVYALVAQAMVTSSTALSVPAGSWLALPVGTLATLIPSTPGYVGTYDYFTAQAMVLAGNEGTAAAAFAFLIHLVLWLPPTLAGGLYFMLRPPLGGLPKEQAT